MSKLDQYLDLLQPQYLTREFIKSYENKKPPFGSDFGLVVFLRTYSRFIEKLKRRESWGEMVARVVEYSMSLYKGPASLKELKEEAQRLYESIFNMEVFPAGRTMWVGGVPGVDAISQFNCSYRNIDSIEAYPEILFILMVGCGSGFSVESKYISNLPKFNRDISVNYSSYNALPKEVREENTELEIHLKNKKLYLTLDNSFLVDRATSLIKEKITEECKVIISVGDSRYGWSAALKAYLHLMSNFLVTEIEFNFDSVRPQGERIKGFGGRASGPKALETMFKKMTWTIKNSSGFLNSVEAMDLCNYIAEGVVAGGTRRSSQIALGDLGDEVFSTAKYNLWTINPTEEESYKLIKLLSDREIAIDLDILHNSLKEEKRKNKYLEGIPFKLVLEQLGERSIDILWSGEEQYKEISSYIDSIDPKYRYRSTRVMSNNSVHIYDKPSREELSNIFDKVKNNGEPGLVIASNAMKRRPNYKGLNPCFTGDMKLLTDKGYVEFQDLEDKEINVVNRYGNVTLGKVWSSGIKECIELRLSNGSKLKCTPDHVWLTPEGEVEARNLKNKQVVPFLKVQDLDKLYIRAGFIQGDGVLTRLDSSTHKGIEIYIGEKDQEVFSLFDNTKFTTGNKSIYLNDPEVIDTLKQLGYCTNPLPTRELPSHYSSFSRANKASFLRGCYSANGSVINTGRITYKSTCKKLIEQIQESLYVDFGIESYYTTNKPKVVQFSNGAYECKESYDLNIGKYEDRVKFFNEIGFVQSYKTEKLAQFLYEDAPYVTSIKDIGEHKVYDFTEPEVHWGVVNGYIAHNCAEILLDDSGVCNLTEVNLDKFVIEKDNFDVDRFLSAVEIASRMGSRITNVDMWHPDWDYIQKRDRLLGVSLTGQVSAWDKLGWGYSIDENGYVYEEDERIKHVYKLAKEIAISTADSYHEEMGIPKAVLVTTGKPSGTVAQLPSISSGIHRPYSPYYLRRIRINRFDPVALALRDLGLEPVPENDQGSDLYGPQCSTWVFTFPMKTDAPIRAIDERAVDQLNRYKLIMDNYIQHNQSITVTVAWEEWDEVIDWLNEEENWQSTVGVSFLPRWDVMASESPFPLLPYQPSTEEEYKEVSKSVSIDENILINTISKYEQSYEEEVLDSDCNSKSFCPVR